MKRIDTLIHEVTHILVFSPNLYPNFIDENGNKRAEVIKSGTYRGHEGAIIITPNVVEAAKNHFNCSNA
jgi:leishmanolysin